MKKNKRYNKIGVNGGAVQKVKRRSVTLTDMIDDRIMKLRSYFISNGLDLNYTTALNFLVHYGAEKLQTGGWDVLAFKILREHFESDELNANALVDQWTDLQEFRKWKEQNTKKKTVPETKELQ